MAKKKEHWTLDKRIPLAFILTVVAMFGSTVALISKMDNRVTSLEASDTKQSLVIENLRDAGSTINTSLARIQERQSAAAAQAAESNKEIKDTLKEIKDDAKTAAARAAITP